MKKDGKMVGSRDGGWDIYGVYDIKEVEDEKLILS